MPPRANCKEVGALAFPRKRLVHCFTKRFRGNARRNCVRRHRVLSCRVSRACSSRIGPCILLMLPQPDQDLEQRAASLQPADDGLRVGPEVMPVSSVTLSDGHGRENARRPVLGRLGELGGCPPGHAGSVDLGCLHRAMRGVSGCRSRPQVRASAIARAWFTPRMEAGDKAPR
jgi:hypothetical protein